MTDREPPIGITMGCPAGIGPEITVKALATLREAETSPDCVVLGDVKILEKACNAAGEAGMSRDIRAWSPGRPLRPGCINVLEVTRLSPAEITWGRISEATGRASYSYIQEAIRLALNGTISAMVTAPISKAGLKLAGVAYPGHTEILAAHTETSDYAMMLAGDRLRVSLVTIHCPFREITGRISTGEILRLLRITDRSLKTLFGIARPEIAVAALNPHAGEGGMFGDEEQTIITPAVAGAVAEGINAHGPFPPDTVFHAAWNGRFHAVVCMYHDQGLIPFKLVHFSDGVNVTLGLPIIRTSVDHGTAYDIAGTGTAHRDSMLAAINMAATFVKNRGRQA